MDTYWSVCFPLISPRKEERLIAVEVFIEYNMQYTKSRGVHNKLDDEIYFPKAVLLNSNTLFHRINGVEPMCVSLFSLSDLFPI